MIELDDGRTLARVIDRSRKTLVVLDGETLAPLQRLWCLYEIGETPPHKVALIKHQFRGRDIFQQLQEINAETAQCFADDDRVMIRSLLRRQWGSLARFTEELRLRLLLEPMSYDADVRVLRARGKGVEYRLGELCAHINAGAGRAACIVGGAGKGKSTLAAQTLEFVHASHFCKRTDSRRQDVVAVVHSLAYQLAYHFPAVRAAILGLDAVLARLVQTDKDAALEWLLVRPLRALAAAGQCAIVLVDGLDEAQGSASNAVVRLLRDLGKAATGALSLVATTRPVPPATLAVLRVAWGTRRLATFAPNALRAPAAAASIGDAAWDAALEAKQDVKIFQIVVRSYAARHGTVGALPTNVNAAYRLWFEAEPPTLEARCLLGVLAAARQPLSSAFLHDLGLADACAGLPGWGLLFERREHLVQVSSPRAAPLGPRLPLKDSDDAALKDSTLPHISFSFAFPPPCRTSTCRCTSSSLTHSARVSTPQTWGAATGGSRVHACGSCASGRAGQRCSTRRATATTTCGRSPALRPARPS